MARRPNFEKERVLTPAEIKQLQDNLANLSQQGVRQLYERAYRECRMGSRDFPSALSIQQLVQAWKQLRKWQGR